MHYRLDAMWLLFMQSCLSAFLAIDYTFVLLLSFQSTLYIGCPNSIKNLVPFEDLIFTANTLSTSFNSIINSHHISLIVSKQCEEDFVYGIVLVKKIDRRSSPHCV